MDMANESNLGGRNATQDASYEADDGHRQYASEAGMKDSAKTAGIDGFGDDAESYGEGGYENASQGLHDDYVRDNTNAVQDLGESGKPDKEGMSGVKGWISSKLRGGSKAEHKHEDEALGDGHGSHDSAKTGKGTDTYSGGDELTTDSGEAVRSISDGPPRSFTIPPLGSGEDPENSFSTESPESQRT